MPRRIVEVHTIPDCSMPGVGNPHYRARFFSFLAAGDNMSLTRCRLIFISAERGRDSQKCTSRGVSNAASRLAQKSSTSCAAISASARNVITATTRCPQSGSGSPTTHASSTASSCRKTCSTLVGETFSPPLTMRSVRRSRITSERSSRCVPQSPVANQPSASTPGERVCLSSRTLRYPGLIVGPRAWSSPSGSSDSRISVQSSGQPTLAPRGEVVGGLVAN